MARYVEDVVHPPQNPPVAVVVQLGAIAGEVTTRKAAPVGLTIAVVVSVDRAEHAGPRLGDGQVAAAGCERRAVGVDQFGADTGKRHRGRTRLGGGHTGERGDHDATGLRLPPGVYDGAPAAADVLVIPHPRFRIDGLADGPQEPELGEVVPGGEFWSPLHEGADGRWCGVEHRDAMLGAQGPEPVAVRPIGRPFVHDDGGAVGQRAVHHVRMARDPADVGRTPEDVFVLEIEHVFGGGGCLGEVATGGVHDPFGFAGGARGVQDEQEIFRVHRFRRSLG